MGSETGKFHLKSIFKDILLSLFSVLLISPFEEPIMRKTKMEKSI